MIRPATMPRPAEVAPLYGARAAERERKRNEWRAKLRAENARTRAARNEAAAPNFPLEY